MLCPCSMKIWCSPSVGRSNSWAAPAKAAAAAPLAGSSMARGAEQAREYCAVRRDGFVRIEPKPGGGAANPLERRARRTGALERGARADGNEDKRRERAINARRVSPEADLLRRQRQRGGQRLEVRRLAVLSRRAVQRELRIADAAFAFDHFAGKYFVRDLQHDHHLAARQYLAGPGPRERNGGADHGLRAEGALFSPGRENTDAGAVHGVARRACESRREVELPRHGGHLAAREAVRVFEHDQRLAGEFAVREDVERMKAQWLFHQASNSPCISRIVTLSRYSMSSTINPSSNVTNSASSTKPRRPVPR